MITVCATALAPHEQERWVQDVRRVLKAAPLVRPITPTGTPMRVRVSAAGTWGWVGDGEYRYDKEQANGSPWPMMPAEWKDLATMIAGDHPWDSAIINWYDPDASLGWHQDKSEHDTSLPIVTVSLGDACSWAVKDHFDKTHRCRLESGAVTLLADEYRDAPHTVERIIAAPLFSPLKTRGRISITMRVAG